MCAGVPSYAARVIVCGCFTWIRKLRILGDRQLKMGEHIFLLGETDCTLQPPVHHRAHPTQKLPPPCERQGLVLMLFLSFLFSSPFFFCIFPLNLLNNIYIYIQQDENRVKTQYFSLTGMAGNLRVFHLHVYGEINYYINYHSQSTFTFACNSIMLGEK